VKYESSSTIKKINELIKIGSVSNALVLLEELVDKHPTVRSLRLFKGILEKKHGAESDKRIRYINEISPEDFCLCLNVTYRELSRIEQLFTIWVALCRKSPSLTVMVDLKIFFDVLSEKECSEVENLIIKTNLSSVFNSVEIINLNIPSEFNFYKRDVDGSVNINDFPYGYKSGPNFQFFRLLGSPCLANYKYVLVTESDCYPTCVDWLSKILFEISSKKEFWVLGSPFRGRSKIGPDIALHINGVAVYSISEVGFKELLELWEFQLKNSILLNILFAIYLKSYTTNINNEIATNCLSNFIV
jgi:hypothetical protein